MRNEPKPEAPKPTINIRFKTLGQRNAWRVIDQSRVTFLTGKAGTAKTFLAVAYALKATLEWENQKSIIVIRPAVEAGEDIGALPGDLDEKMRPFLAPVFRTLDKICGTDANLKQQVNKILEILSVGYTRGVTFEDSIVILDEAQNLDRKQMRMILTRLGPNSKLILCGDTKQSDIEDRSVLLKTAMIQSQHDGVGWYKFGPEDQVRDPLVNLLDDSMEYV
jgi:phosphate starvation-inducible PhoH-like protein